MLDAALILLLAQTCVAEIDLQKSPAECFVMWEVNERAARRRGIDLASHTRRYNSYWRVPHNGRRWIGALDASGNAPDGWPASRSWARERACWLAYLEAAGEFASAAAAGRYRARCAAAHTYGGTPGDGVHADDPEPCPGARRVRCLRNERQAYWNVTACRKRGALPAEVAAGKPDSGTIRR